MTKPGCGDLDAFCPNYQLALEIIGRRWSGAIVRSLLAGNTRFTELQGTVPGLSSRLLSERLKELEAEGIIQRRVVPTMPVRIDYELTKKGEELLSVVRAVSDWAERWQPATGGQRRSG